MFVLEEAVREEGGWGGEDVGVEVDEAAGHRDGGLVRLLAWFERSESRRLDPGRYAPESASVTELQVLVGGDARQAMADAHCKSESFLNYCRLRTAKSVVPIQVKTVTEVGHPTYQKRNLLQLSDCDRHGRIRDGFVKNLSESLQGGWILK